MFEKLKYPFSLFDNTEILIVFLLLLVYHMILVGVICLSVRASASARGRILAERDELKRALETRDAAWRDRENELRRILTLEKEREVLQLKAEYDSYVNLLEARLMNSKPREQVTS
jgi:Tfp pilus assembly protein PilX